MSLEERQAAWRELGEIIKREMLDSVAFTGRMEFYNGQWGGIYGNEEQGFKRRVNGKFVPIEENE